MQQSRRAPARRHPNRGKKAFTTNAAPQQHAIPETLPRVATPPLTEAVPLDTPRFADLAKENLLHPILLETILTDLKFDRKSVFHGVLLPSSHALRVLGFLDVPSE